jgi:type VI secretion system secreted protein Hcp
MFATARARRPRTHRLTIERLEGRDVPAAVVDPLFTIAGEVTAPREPDWVQMQVQTGSADRVLLSFTAETADGSAFRPGGLKVFAGDDAQAWNIGPAGRPGFALKEVSSGTIFARVAGAQGSTGAFDVSVGLAGDVTNDGQVTTADLDQIRALNGVRANQAGFDPAADVNHNGVIGVGDRRLALRNVGVTVDVGPLTADQFLFAGSAGLGLSGGTRAPLTPGTTPDISLIVPTTISTDPIKVDAFSWGVVHEGGTGGGGGGAGRPVKGDVSLVMETSKASPKLFLACASGTHYPEMEILIGRRAGTKGVQYLEWQMQDVLVSSYQIGGTDAGNNVVLSDAATLNFQKLTVTYYPKLPNGQAGDPVTATFDFAEGTPS